MIDPPFLPLVPLNVSEEGVTWEDFAPDPMLLFKEFARRYAIQGNTVNDNIIKSSKTPDPKDRGKIWVKDSWPYAIGAIMDGEYRMDYGPSGLVPNVPFLHQEYVPALEFVRMLSSSELTDFGLVDTTSTTANAVTRMRWYIFEPLEIKI